MNRGIVLFAYNSNDCDYLRMAQWTAKRANDFCDLPVTLITDAVGAKSTENAVFDRVITTESVAKNYRNGQLWYNSGRSRAWELSPYQDTIVLDSDYIINSRTLNRLFEIDNDFLCHNAVQFLMDEPAVEYIGKHGPPTLWATVMRFMRSARAEQIFSIMNMVEKNYNHYGNIYNFVPAPYRNDYALTIAHRAVSGAVPQAHDYIPWNLLNISSANRIDRLDNTRYRLTKHYPYNDNRKTWTLLRDLDFHMLGKQNCMEIMSDINE